MRALREAITDIAGQRPTYGSRRIKEEEELKRAPYRIRVGRHLFRRLMREMNLLVKPKRRARRTTDSDHSYRRYRNLLKGIEVTRPDQV